MDRLESIVLAWVLFASSFLLCDGDRVFCFFFFTTQSLLIIYLLTMLDVLINCCYLLHTTFFMGVYVCVCMYVCVQFCGNQIYTYIYIHNDNNDNKSIYTYILIWT